MEDGREGEEYVIVRKAVVFPLRVVLFEIEIDGEKYRYVLDADYYSLEIFFDFEKELYREETPIARYVEYLIRKDDICKLVELLGFHLPWA